MRLAGTKRLGGRGSFKVVIWGRASHKGGTDFYGEKLTPLDTMALSNNYYAFNTILTRKIHHNILYFVNTT